VELVPEAKQSVLDQGGILVARARELVAEVAELLGSREGFVSVGIRGKLGKLMNAQQQQQCEKCQ